MSTPPPGRAFTRAALRVDVDERDPIAVTTTAPAGGDGRGALGQPHRGI